MTKRLIVVDGNNYGFAGMAGANLSSGGKDTQAIFSFIKAIRKIKEDHPNDILCVAWDGRSWRKDVYGEYKANRSKTEKQVQAVSAYVEQKKDIMKALRLLGIRQTSADNWEADDIAWLLARNATDKGIPCTLLTADCDWQQLVQKGTIWIDNIHAKSCRIESFEQDTGYKTPEQFLEAKCILGDAGDNVKGVKGIGEKTLDNIYTIYPSFAAFMEDDKESQSAKWLELTGKKLPKVLRELDVEATKATIELNMTLMDLATANRPKAINLKTDKGNLDLDAFKEFCYENAFMSIIRTYDKFMLPFKVS